MHAMTRMSGDAPGELGSLCLVLHGHLPYVLHHGAHPHGEAWLYEAAAETYLPLLDVLQDVVAHRMQPGVTIGLTPVLLEQLAHAHFKQGFVAYLNERMERASQDRGEFERMGQGDMAYLADRWETWHRNKLSHFERIGRDIPGQFAAFARAGHIEVLTGAATHAYLPLLLNDQMIWAQLRCGSLASARHLGASTPGVWLPECAYRPAEPQWKPAVLYDDPRNRPGLETFLTSAGLTHFFVDSHLLTLGEPLGIIEHGSYRAMNETQLYWDSRRGWRSAMEPVGVSSSANLNAPPGCVALARHPHVSQRVWSAMVGYPAAGEYLEFHRKHGERGLRYHRITSPQTPLGEKEPYAPEDVFTKLYEHSQDFCETIRAALRQHRDQTGRPGVVVAPFDAELFGHWWFEGPTFLRDLMFTLGRDKQVAMLTARQALERHPPDKVMRLPEGSWGKGGGHDVWLNDRNRWMWEVEYRAEGRMLKLLHELPWRTSAEVRGMMERAARELLLLQASDWPFVIDSGGAVDYGIQRFSGHATRFDRMLDIALHVSAGHALQPIQQLQIDEADAHDDVFAGIALEWWM